MMTKATIRVPGLKVAVPLAADALPRDLVPMEGPAGEPTLELVLDGRAVHRHDVAGQRVGGQRHHDLQPGHPDGGGCRHRTIS